MPREWWLKCFFYLALTLLSVYLLLPNTLGVSEETIQNPNAPWYVKLLPSTYLNLGLDLRGGVHIVLGIEVEKAIESETDKLASDLEEYLKREKIEIDRVVRKPGLVAVNLELPSASIEAARTKIKEIYYGVLEETRSEKLDNGKVNLRLDVHPDHLALVRTRSVEQALKTIRNRVDEFGVAEPTIQKLSDRQILIQLPGVKDPDRAIELLGKTALLEFKLVSEKMGPTELDALIAPVKESVGFRENFTRKMVDDLNAVLVQKLPEGTQIRFSKEVDSTTKAARIEPYLLESRTLLTGDALDDARVRASDRLNKPEVSLSFSPRGAAAFERITESNVDRRLAIVLDDVVVSDPVINEKIPAAGAGAVISLGRGTQQEVYEEAHDLALVLRAGALPAPVQVEENRTVGAALGQDSIEKGRTSFIIAAGVIVLFMFLYYRMLGLFGNAALLLNMLFVMASMAVFGATLTLPGIAGIVLTIGMAVDANVIINERIREELNHGKSVRAAIEAGYSNANLPIVDANLTTAIAGFALYYFGTGPIRGFAVTLLIGLVSSYVTSVYVTKLLLDLWVARFNFERNFTFTASKGEAA